jgi:hypothetical protein
LALSVGQHGHPGAGGEGEAEFAGVSVEAGLEKRAFAQGMRLGGQGGVDEEAQHHGGDGGLVQGLEQPGGVAPAAAAGIVGHIGEDEGLAGGFGAGEGGFQAGEIGDVAVALIPGAAGQLLD